MLLSTIQDPRHSSQTQPDNLISHCLRQRWPTTPSGVGLKREASEVARLLSGGPGSQDEIVSTLPGLVAGLAQGRDPEVAFDTMTLCRVA